ncbi:MAG: hypothetical protein JW779_05765 [Candidatus Thorarchaeota archaeon]|nr:hypothetical protein [Candidatus Thorarchaeota archaeon]
MIAIIFILLLGTIVAVCDHYYKKPEPNRFFKWLGAKLFGAYFRSLMIWELLVITIFIVAYFDLFKPEYYFSSFALFYWFIGVFGLFMTALWNHLRYYPVDKKEYYLGQYLIEVSKEKAAHNEEMTLFFTKLIADFENQHEHENYAEYEAAKTYFLKSDDAVGIRFRKIYKELIDSGSE